MRAGQILGWDEEVVDWRVADRIERSRSTIFRLELPGAPAPGAEIYYKVSHSPVDGSAPRERWESVMADGLGRTMAMDAKLAEALRTESIAFARALAVDPKTMTLATLGVSGTAVGKVVWHGITPRRRRRLLESFRLAGVGARLIEQCSPPGIEAERTVFTGAIDRRLRRARSVIPESMARALEKTMATLDEEVLSNRWALVYAHGDFSSSNVLLREGGIGLIDFTWPPRLRGFDVAHFAFRVEYETGAPAGWTTSLVDALLAGYDDPDLRSSARWSAIRIPRLLKVIELGAGSGLDRHRRAHRRAMEELESLV